MSHVDNSYRPRRPSQNSSDGQRRRPSMHSTDSRYSIGEGFYQFSRKVAEFFNGRVWCYDHLLEKGVVFMVRSCARFPCAFVSVQLLVLILVVVFGMLGLPMDIDADFDSFLSTDVESSLINDAYWAAHAARPKPGYAQRRLNETTNKFRVKEIILYYEVQGKYSNIFETKVMHEIARIENKLRSSGDWRQLCDQTFESDRNLCNVGVSFPNFVLAQQVKLGNAVVPDYLKADGSGDDPVPLRAALHTSLYRELENVFFIQDVAEPFRAATNNVPSSTTRLRSVFRFKLPAGGPSALSKAEAESKWENVLKKVVMSYFDKSKSSFVRVIYDATDLGEVILKDTLNQDMLLAIASATFVVLYLLFHTRSIALTVMAILTSMLAVPIAYILTSVITDTRRVNFTSFLAVFLLVGFGADVVFVYTDFWNESAYQYKDMSERLLWTYQRAGRASLATTGVTCLAFFANLASVIRALRQFGFFMGLCVTLAWIFISAVYTPMLIVDEKYCYYLRFLTKGAGRRRTQCMKSLTQHIHKLRYMYLLLGLAMLGSVAPAVLKFKLNTGLPDLYPDDHNMNSVTTAGNEFVSLRKTVMKSLSFSSPEFVNVCSETNFTDTVMSGDSQYCELRWCEASHTLPAIPKGTCSCFVGSSVPASNCPGATEAEVVQVIASRSLLSMTNWTRGTTVREMLPSLGITYTTVIPSFEAPLVVNEWESGITTTRYLTRYKIRGDRTVNTTICGWTEYCYCETKPCGMDAPLVQQQIPVFPVGFPSRRLEEHSWPNSSGVGTSRQLQAATATTTTLLPGSIVTTATVANSKQLIIRVLFGIWANTDLLILGERPPEEMWDYQSSFDLSTIWTQRNLLEFCRSVSSDPQLLVVRKFCWLEEFRNWVVNTEKLKFPVTPVELFHTLAVEFMTVRGNILGDVSKGYEKVWVVNGNVRATQADFALNVHEDASREKITAIKKLWDARVKRFNSDEAKEEARGAVLVSEEFAKVDADSQLVVSAAVTFGVLLVLAFLGMVFFTCSIVLSLIVVLTSVVIICALGCFIIVALQWEVGLLEVIATIYFIGYAVTYSLHITHKYAYSEGLLEHAGGNGHYTSPRSPRNSDKRFLRTRYAMMSIGGATLGSSITTAGASFFLIFSTLRVFTKLGTMCLCVTVLSIIVALFPLPAFLCVLGPMNPGRGCCCRGRDRPRGLQVAGGAGMQSPRGQPNSNFPNPDLPRHFSL